VAFIATILEAMLALLLVRFAYRAVARLVFRGRRGPGGRPGVADAGDMPVQTGD
jgi:hypothetical protein